MATLATPKLLLPVNFSTIFQKRKTTVFAYTFMFTFLACTLFVLLYSSPYSPSSSTSNWLLKNLNNFKNPSFLSPNASHLSSLFSHFLPNSSSFSTSPSLDFLSPSSNKTQIVGNYSKYRNFDFKSMLNCDIFDGKWVRDDSYPLYAPGSCPYIDEGFNCFLNGRPDNAYEKFRWQPNHCNIPRLNATHMLELLRGKRIVFLGDSLNRNMWESLVCILRNSVQNKSGVFEASGRSEFRSQGSYSFIFKDYNCSVEYFRSTFLVQAWEFPGKNGLKKATLRLDLVEQSFDRYKDADILVFNSGHWWTRGRTSRGRGYYQEGNHVFEKLSPLNAYGRAMKTWAKWVDSNVDPIKTQVFFRGYSSTHFRGGRWNSGGKCDKETEPFKNETYLLSYPPKMQILEDVMKGMKTPVFYLNITRLTDYRKDAHPAIFRAQKLSDEESRAPLIYQDCSHWCLPGVPDTWNELIYAQILTRQYQKHEHQ